MHGVLFVNFIDLVAAHSVGEFTQFILCLVQDLFDSGFDVNGERSLVHFFDVGPNPADLRPNLKQIVVVFLNDVKLVGVSQLHIQQLFGLAHALQLTNGLTDEVAVGLQLGDRVLDLTRGLARVVIGLPEHVVVVLYLDILNGCLDFNLFTCNFSLQSFGFFLQDIVLALSGLFELVPLALDLIDGVCFWPFVLLFLQHFLARFDSLELVAPLILVPSHFLHFCHKNGDVLTVVQIQAFEAVTRSLDNCVELFHLRE